MMLKREREYDASTSLANTKNLFVDPRLESFNNVLSELSLDMSEPRSDLIIAVQAIHLAAPFPLSFKLTEPTSRHLSSQCERSASAHNEEHSYCPICTIIVRMEFALDNLIRTRNFCKYLELMDYSDRSQHHRFSLV